VDKRRTRPGFLTNDEAARERQRTQDLVRSIIGTKQSKKPNVASCFVPDPNFWGSSDGQIVRAIVLNRAYDRDAILKVTLLSEEDFEQALRDLLQDGLLEEKEGGKLWVTRELYWQCQSFFQQSQQEEEREALLASSEHIEISKEKTLENHVTSEQFLLEFFGVFGRDLGNPERWFTDNPTDTFPFIEECAENKLPAFMSVQPEKDKAQPLGIEKIFFDFDYCKNSEILAEAETQKRKADLRKK
jgi:hypothetical protein